MASHFISPLGGPDDRDVRPPQRPGCFAWLLAAVVVALVIAFLVVNRA